MDKWNAYAGTLTQFFLRIAEVGGALVLALLAVYLLLGDTAGRYVVSVTDNVADFISKVTPQRLRWYSRLAASHAQRPES